MSRRPPASGQHAPPGPPGASTSGTAGPASTRSTFEPPRRVTYRGYYRSTVLFSDDEGTTWSTGPQSLPVPVPDILYAYGAVEPVAVELGDGRVWMLIRTQMGRAD